MEVTKPTAEAWQEIKVHHVYAALNSDPVDIQLLRHEAVSKGGLLFKEVRKKAWPKLLGINVFHIPKYHGPSLFSHKEKAQVMLDVNRCGRRIPKEFSETDRAVLQDQLARVILRLLATHSKLCYYQGLHDVTLTVLLVMEDEDTTFAIMERLAQCHLRDFLDSNMNYTKQIIGYISPLLSLVDDELQQYILKSECQYYFSLSWLITWFSHDIMNLELVDRIFDLFFASDPMMPVYFSAAFILSRKDEILAEECEMSSIHGLLSNLPDQLDYEEMMREACSLYKEYPVSSVAKYGRIRLKDSYMNESFYQFGRLTKWQRPDHVLKDLPETPSQETLTMKKMLIYSAPIVVGLLVYWVIKYNYHYQLYNMVLNRTKRYLQ